MSPHTYISRLLPAMVLFLCSFFFVDMHAWGYDPNHFPGRGSKEAWKEAWVFCTKGNDLVDQGKYLQAEEFFKKAISIYPYDAGFFFCNAKVLRHTERISGSINMYKKAIELSSNYWEAYDNMADACNCIKRFSDAEMASKKALSINPKSMASRINLAETEIGRQRYAEARKWLDDAKKYPDAEFQSALKADYEKLRELTSKSKQASD